MLGPAGDRLGCLHLIGPGGSMTGTGVERLTVVRGGTAVLREVTLQAAEGELLVVLGASGSGKTMLLRVIAGLEQPSSGEVVIRGRAVTGLAPGQRRAIPLRIIRYA